MKRLLLGVVLASVVSLVVPGAIAPRPPRAHAEPVHAVMISKSVCLALLTAARGGGAGLECLSGPNEFTNLDNLKNVALSIGNHDDVLEASDLQDLDLDGNQLHQQDGLSYIFLFVNAPGPIRIHVPGDAGTILRPNGTVVAGNEYICSFAADDPDCQYGAPGANGIVVFGLCSGTGSPVAIPPQCGLVPQVAQRGKYTLTIDQNRYPLDINYQVVGEPRTASFQVFEPTIGAGIVDVDNDGNLTDKVECPANLSSAAFTHALGLAEKTIVFLRVADIDGTNVTGAWVTFKTDDPDVGVFALSLLPTLDIGSFGFAAPNILCGTKKAGKLTLTATITQGPVKGLDPGASVGPVSTEETVVGQPASLSLTAVPAEINCDGLATVEVAANVIDSDGTPVANGTMVQFDVSVLGTANPIIATTSGGIAKTTVTPLSGVGRGVPVIVSTGPTRDPLFDPQLQQSILVSCSAAGPPPAVPAAGGGAPGGGSQGAGAGPISGPNTGSGPAGATGSGALPWWPAIALFGAAIALRGCRMLLGRARRF